MKRDIHNLLGDRILLLDGGFGTMIQALGLRESDFRGREFLSWKCPLAGCMDLLCLTAPRKIADIHRAYLEAGADIITTNSFSANAISLREYGLEGYARRIAREAARIAREVADGFESAGGEAMDGINGAAALKPRFVAGSMGPTSKTASIAASVEDSAARDVTFRELADAYYDQAAGLAEGGVDLFLLETVFDTLNAKAAIFAIDRLRSETGCDIPLMISVTVSQKAGRTLSGQTIEAFWTSVKHARPLSVGINCSFGAREMLPHLERLAAVADCYISVHPNAGLPNISGGYDETPESFAAAMKPYAERGLINIMGGCCGTTPEFIRALAPLAASFKPRRVPEPNRETVVSGLEELRIVPEANFINIGERCNVAGSAKFARMIREGDFAGAMAVARAQVAAGAQIIDVCMDDGLIDGPAAMRTFLNMAAGEVDIARVPVMVDSSSFDTIIAGLECCQGKAIVNSISLKEGPEEFLRRAMLIRSYGAAAVVMLFDEEGQATSFERKVAVARRAFGLLTGSGFPAEDIIFDPNILAVATGIKEHDRYALDFIEAVRWIKANLPGAKVSGGVSNLSFAFRGNNPVREAMHSAFLYHARLAGMDMGIVNPGMLRVYDDIEPALLERVEDVILCRRDDAAERLLELAAKVKESAVTQVSAGEDWRSSTPGERISYAMLHGVADHIETDCLEALAAAGSPLEVINRMMMPAMERVGALFGEGKMFLPQVVKAAGVMKRGVAALQPYIASVKVGDSTHCEGDGTIHVNEGSTPQQDEATTLHHYQDRQFPSAEAGVQHTECQHDTQTNPHQTEGGYIQQRADYQPSTHQRPKVVIATVKGDIHDIGKNIVAVVMAVGGCEIIDLGVMVEPAAIVAAVQEHHANFVCLSGLITPSLEQMIVVIRELRRAGITITVIVGGATTSPMHTAVKMAPEYDGLVVHSTDASRNMQIITSLTSPTARVFAAGILADQKRLRELYASAQDRRPLADYRERLAEAEFQRQLSPAASEEKVREGEHQHKLKSEPERSFLAAAEGEIPATAPESLCLANFEISERYSPAQSFPPQNVAGFHHYDIVAVERHIDWDMFCAEWGVKKEEDKKQLIADAQQMLERLKRENILDLQGVIATLPVHVEGDDIVVLHGKQAGTQHAVHQQDAGNRSHSAIVGDYQQNTIYQQHTLQTNCILPMLRNQTIGEDNLSVADFAAEAGRITFFAISAGVGLKQFAEGLRKDGDEYGAFMAKVLADRLAEALAEEVVPAAEGERHAFGYPSCPDHSLKRDVFDLLQVEHLTNMRLTDSYMIDPAESICGMIIPGARYFAVGRIAEDQLLDYAHRRSISPEIIKTLIPRNIQ